MDNRRRKMNPKIISLGYALPQYSATQQEAFDHLGYKSPLTRRIFENTGIERRYSYIDPERFKEKPSWQELTEEYEKGAVELGAAAARDALDGFGTENIRLITFVSVTGYTCPSSSYAIAGELGLRRDVAHTNILGQGCQGSVPGIERAYDYVKSRGGTALAISCEIGSATYFPVKTERDLDVITSAAIFGDAACAALVGYSDDPQYPELVDFESRFDPQHLKLLGYKWEDGRMKVVLSTRVPEIVPPLIKATVDILLARNKLCSRNISHWILHPGGKAVLNNLEKQLGLSHEQTFWSWEVMKRMGNVSSATIGIIAKFVQQNERPRGWGVAATMGAGGATNAALLRWGDNARP